EFTKNQILELYLNQIFLGKGSYGITAAGLTYFSKELNELTIAEIAFLAGLPKAPSNYDPERNYDRAINRRNYVLDRLAEDEIISNEHATLAKQTPIELTISSKQPNFKADYFADSTKKQLAKIITEEKLENGGLQVITTLNSNYQKIAEQKLRKGLLVLDQKNGYRGPVTVIDSLDNWQEQLGSVKHPAGAGMWQLAVVLGPTDDYGVYNIGYLDGTRSTIDIKKSKWALSSIQANPRLLRRRAVILVEERISGPLLRQIPEVNGALVVQSAKDGRVLAMSSGFDYELSVFNRATQAKRQTGSLFKTFVYLAALESGIEPNHIFDDGPLELEQGVDLPMWKPKNYDDGYLGPITMRQGIERSRNLITVRVAQEVGVAHLQQLAKRLGINDEPSPFLSISLGALESSLLRITNAYAMIASGGYQLQPQFVERINDARGKKIFNRANIDCIAGVGSAIPSCTNLYPSRVIDAKSNYQIISMLQGVVNRGTAKRLKGVRNDLSAKTGTSNDSKDIWCVAFTPDVVVGVYIGYDQPKELGRSVYSATHAVPVVKEFIKSAMANVKEAEHRIPSGVEFKLTDYQSGKVASKKSSNIIAEVFKTQDHESSNEVTNSESGLYQFDFEAIY
ncbi:MAG: penicillin-binding transpeptidase domain-containing protein, partial [Pseudomonadota bacterium]